MALTAARTLADGRAGAGELADGAGGVMAGDTGGALADALGRGTPLLGPRDAAELAGGTLHWCRSRTASTPVSPMSATMKKTRGARLRPASGPVDESAARVGLCPGMAPSAVASLISIGSIRTVRCRLR